MKMVDGSTVRHGRVDCSYPEKSKRAQRAESQAHRGSEGETREERQEGNEEGGKKEMK